VQRFGSGRPFARADGVKAIVSALREGAPLYLLPDMNFGPEESIFVPFYGVPAATVPSLSRFARLGRAKVVPLVTRLTRDGYEIRVLPAWKDFPSDDVTADTALMNERLQGYIDAVPDQYYWVHKRFKTRPPGMPPGY
jgi:KDO2-lipid IV(A) lauroyltransferase